jgi:POT family proton-dependent oligopeptide transporter
MDDAAVARPVSPGRFARRFKHPPGLAILFFAEMWERFSYYGMRGLLKLYMANYLFITAREALQGCRQKVPPCGLVPGNPGDVFFWDSLRSLFPGHPAEAASVIYGWYTGLVYFTPFFGGILADRWLGRRKTVILGSLLMAVGHFVMASEQSFFLALLLLILGNGAFKPNVSTQVGDLYAPGDSRRDGAFTIFYMGINLGAFLSNLVCGTLAAIFGWHVGFAAAGVGMLLGLSVYTLGRKYLAPEVPVARQRAERPVRDAAGQRAGRSAWAAVGAGVAAAAAFLVLRWSPLLLVAGVSFLAAVVLSLRTLPQAERRAVGALLLLCALNVVFWAVYEQQGNTMQSWADERTRWPSVLGFQIPSTWFQSWNPFLIILLAPLLDLFWARQARRQREPSSVSKMAIGCILLGLSFIVMIIGALSLGGAKGSLFWPLFCTFLLTVGELYLSPIGLSLVTKVAPARMVSMLMGVWLGSSFVGNVLSGVIGVLYTRWSNAAFFLLLTGLGVAAGLGIWVLGRPLRAALGNK